MGREWYEEPNGGKYLCKKNTFDDFVDVARFLVEGWTTPDMLSCEGRSAGGLLIGAAIIDGRHRPGERLIETELAAGFGVSRGPIREALRIYRNHFRPSTVLDKPYVMLGVPLLAADSDEQAQYLATSAFQSILALIRGQRLVQRKPVPSMDGLWLPHERQAVGEFFGLATIGGPQTVRQRLEQLLEQTEADELIFTCDMYDFADRLHAFDILAELQRG